MEAQSSGHQFGGVALISQQISVPHSVFGGQSMGPWVMDMDLLSGEKMFPHPSIVLATVSLRMHKNPQYSSYGLPYVGKPKKSS